MSDRRVTRALSLTQLAVMAALLWLFYIGAAIPAEHHWSQPATTAEKRDHLGQQLIEDLEQWRAEMGQR